MTTHDTAIQQKALPNTMTGGDLAGHESGGGEFADQRGGGMQLLSMQRMANSSSQVTQLMGLQRRVTDAGQGPTSFPATSIQRNADTFELTVANKAAFLARLKKGITNVADATLAPIGQTTQDCPYIAYWFSYYADKDPGHIQTSISRYLKGDVVGTESALIEKITSRVQQALAENVRTGSLAGVPDDVPKDLEEKQNAARKKQVMQKKAKGSGPLQMCKPKEGDVVGGFSKKAVKTAREAYEANPSLALADAWQREIRQQRDGAGGFMRLPPKEKAFVTEQLQLAGEAVKKRQVIEQKQEREDRAIATAQEIEDMRTQGVTPGEVNTHIINDYTNPDTGRAERFFNRPLRTKDMTEEQATGVKSLQEALLRSDIDPQQSLWRGTNHLIGGNNSPVPGETYREQGFFSTSRHRNVAEGFGSMLLNITSQHNGRNIRSLGGDEYGGGEEEVLFPAGSQFVYDGLVNGVHQYREV